jgi:hypothetical protein
MQPSDLLQKGPLLTMVAETLRHTPASNVRNEDRFARQSAQAYVCHGHTASNTSAASRHMLCELQAAHRVAMDRTYFSRAADAAVEQRPETTVRSGWNVFVQDNMARNLGLAELAKEWARVPRLEKFAFTERALKLQEDHLREEPNRSHPGDRCCYGEDVQATPLHLGDTHYPLRPATVQDATANVPKAHRAWKKLVGGVVAAHKNFIVREVDIKQCPDMYGAGVCAKDMTPDDHDAFHQYKRTLWAIARHHRGIIGTDMDDMLLFSLHKVLFARRGEQSPIDLGVGERW